MVRQLCRFEKKAARNIMWLRLLFHTPSPFLMYWLTRTRQLHLLYYGTAHLPTYLAHRSLPIGEAKARWSPMKKNSVGG